jgi:SAM-dependent methyltransferase
MSFAEFEKEYISIRTKEGRVYPDDVVKKLPFIDDPEWKIRARSAQNLLHQLKKENCKSFVEIGCGNGWLTNYLQRELNATATGVDINKVELDQAKRLSDNKAKFYYADIFLDEFGHLRSGTIIFAASIQYFPDFEKLIDVLSGTIHIIDTQFYEDATAARLRSEKYFKSKDAAGMKSHYFHHELKSLDKYDHQFIYRPDRLKKLFGGSPFPYIRIRKD